MASGYASGSSGESPQEEPIDLSTKPKTKGDSTSKKTLIITLPKYGDQESKSPTKLVSLFDPNTTVDTIKSAFKAFKRNSPILTKLEKRDELRGTPGMPTSSSIDRVAVVWSMIVNLRKKEQAVLGKKILTEAEMKEYKKMIKLKYAVDLEFYYTLMEFRKDVLAGKYPDESIENIDYNIRQVNTTIKIYQKNFPAATAETFDFINN